MKRDDAAFTAQVWAERAVPGDSIEPFLVRVVKAERRRAIRIIRARSRRTPQQTEITRAIAGGR
jgi:hypothetical protein